MKGMTPIVRNIASLLSGFVMLYGLYVVSTGHLAPGGGFAGGVIIMAGVVMLVLAFGGDRARELMAQSRCHVLDGSGALAFAVVALFGLFVGGFFRNFLPRGQVHKFLSGGTILPSNLAIALKVAAGLVGIFLALVLATRHAMPKE
jgi:multisubunit Na+/H+ antiporter MnhB subunit